MKRTLFFFTTFFAIAVHAQQLSKEATHEISKKANKGFLYEPRIDEANNQMILTYVTKATGRKVKFENYKFDLNFNFLGVNETEEGVEKIKGYRADKGDEWEMMAVSVERNLMGTLVLRRKLIKKKWNWFWGGYDIKIEQKEKLKPKSEDGNKFFYLTHAEQNESGSVIIVAGEKGDRNDPWRQYKRIHVLRYDADLNQLADQVIEFEHPQFIAAVNTDDADEDAETDADVAILFAPMGGKGMGKIQDPNAGNYTFVRVSADAKVKERISVASNHGIFDASFIGIGNDIVMYGPANENKTDYLNEKPADDKFKAKNFQIVRISGGKVAFVTSTPISDFEKKAQVPPGQKKSPDYTGRKFRVAEVIETSNGDILFTGQNYNSAGGLGRRGAGTEYTDIVMMHFDSRGNLKAQYGVRREENDKEAKMAPNSQLLTESNDGKSLYWTILEMKGVKTEKELGDSKYKFLVYPNTAKINLGAATIGEFVQFGQGKSDYYVNNKYPFLKIGKGQIVFLGENKSGKTLWFAKMPLD
ncbi:MAG: hypothetical protein KGZ74_05940 [Chitinophagaceae bacterium]|nr:hypothetical protein [Chitinophagaceae bacterium]